MVFCAHLIFLVKLPRHMNIIISIGDGDAIKRLDEKYVGNRMARRFLNNWPCNYTLGHTVQQLIPAA